MATIIPNIEKIKISRQKPTDGELSLLLYLEDNFDHEAEVYFQPYFNGDRPDIVILHKERGIIIIEVKDWDLRHYYIDEKNKWYLRKNKVPLRSPFSQVFGYKSNMFEIHINGLLEKKIRNKNFYNSISVFVYFHHETKQSLKLFYDYHIDNYREAIRNTTLDCQAKRISADKHDKHTDYLHSQKKKIERDKNIVSLTQDGFHKIKFPLSKANPIFPESVYDEFKRYLNPPFHMINEGKEIKYEKKQSRLIVSAENNRTKIKGVAGSGKTTVLAKRAVNSHKRHDGRILILTFNLTLRMYIKDKINEVREDFSWGAFDIINYHKFMSQSFNSLGVEFSVPDEIKANFELKGKYLDDHYYSNENVFSGYEVKNKYQTILVDEIQDYKPSWIEIIRKYFLEENGEMVLFGDEKQNIYSREIAEDKSVKAINGFGRWEKLTKSFRYAEDSHVLTLAKEFQNNYFSGIYESDFDDAFQPSLAGIGINQFLNYQIDKLEDIVSYIFKVAKRDKIHPNEIAIISSKISLLKDIDFLIRKDNRFNEKTLTTFESKESSESKVFTENIKKIRSNKKYGFNLNSGVIKVSTIHSFKGYESPTVCLIVDETDAPELVYVGLTRAKINLIVFTIQGSKYESFFKDRLEYVDL
jgi:hypothetical protein